jgi:hypothetical protein
MLQCIFAVGKSANQRIFGGNPGSFSTGMRELAQKIAFF